MATYLFLHGAAHGKWCWDLVTQALSTYGHTAYSIDLPGHGQDATPRQLVGRQSYIDAVSLFLKTSGLSNVTLVGHSLSGTILPAVARENRATITRLVFVSALVLDPGESALDLIPPDRRERHSEAASASPEYSISFSRDTARRIFFNDLSDSEADTYFAKLTPQPFRVYLDKETLAPKLDWLEVIYVMGSLDQTLPLSLCLECARKLATRPISVEAGHDMMLSRPEKLVEILVN